MDPCGANDPAQNPKCWTSFFRRKKPPGRLAGAVTSQRPLLETVVPAAGCQAVVLRFVENSTPNPVDGYGQETMALALLRATARGTRALGSLWPHVLKKMADAMIVRFNNGFFMVAGYR